MISGLWLAISVISLTMCNRAPIGTTSVLGETVTAQAETQSPTITASPTYTPQPSRPTSNIQVTLVIAHPTQQPKATFSLIPTHTAIPAWVLAGEEYSQSQWKNIARSQKPESYIGFQYRFLPKSLIWKLSSTIETYRTGLRSDLGDYGITWVNDGNYDMLWLEKLICRYWDRAYFEVIDVLVLPFIRQKDILIISGADSDCYLNEISDGELVVIAEREPTAIMTNVKKAWRANRSSGVFEVIPVSGIHCVVTISK